MAKVKESSVCPIQQSPRVATRHFRRRCSHAVEPSPARPARAEPPRCLRTLLSRFASVRAPARVVLAEVCRWQKRGRHLPVSRAGLPLLWRAADTVSFQARKICSFSRPLPAAQGSDLVFPTRLVTENVAGAAPRLVLLRTRESFRDPSFRPSEQLKDSLCFEGQLSS